MATRFTGMGETYCINRGRYFLLSIFLLLWAALIMQGCATPVRRVAVPQELVAKAEVPGLPGVRYLVVGEMPEFLADAQESIKRELEYRAKAGQKGPLPPANFLALSGGGMTAPSAPGCFAAGRLQVPALNSSW